MQKPRLFAASLGAMALALLPSCQDEDFGYTSTEIRDAAYDRNFVAKFGEIDPDMSWDLSKYAIVEDASTRATIDPDTKAIACEFDNDDTHWFEDHVERLNEWYYVDPTLVNTFTAQLGEGLDNSDKGGPFTLTSNGSFYIMPMFQGASGIESDLHMVVTTPEGNTYDKCIWDKSAFIQKQTMGSFDWKGLEQKMDYWKDYGGKGENGDYKGGTLYAKGVRSNPIRCDIPKGSNVKFYLHITRGHLNYASNASVPEYDRWSANLLTKDDAPDWLYNEPNLAFTGVKQWSNQGKMIALKSDIFTIDEATMTKYGNNVMLIGCEDALFGEEDAIVYSGSKGATSKTIKCTESYTDAYGSTRNIENFDQNGNQSMKNGKPVRWEGDNDMNDIIFMVVSNALPDVVREDEIKKRYIIEDLGSIVDWDFNDIVVDMVQTTKGSNVTQKAILKHLCGTTPFRLFVGEAGNESNSVELKFTGNISFKDFEGKNNNNVELTQDGKIQGQQMSKEEELNLEYTLPNNKWVPSQNNIWVKVYNPTDKYNNYNRQDGSDEYSNTGNDSYGGNLSQDHNSGNGNNGVVDGEIDGDFNFDNFKIVAFPRKGQVPRIIAVDTDYEWTEEDHDVKPEMWTSITVTAEASNQYGVVSGAGRYRVGHTVTLTAIVKDKEYEFTGWSDGIKEITRTFVAPSSNVAVTANFTHISIKDDPLNGENIDSYWYRDIDMTDVAERIEAGYNTITIVLSNNKYSDAQFALKKKGKDELLTSADPLAYSMKNGNEVTYVLSKEQLNAIKDGNGFRLQNFTSKDGETSRPITISSIKWSKTIDTYTVVLNVDIEGNPTINGDNINKMPQVTTNDGRSTWHQPAAFGKAAYPAGQIVKFTAHDRKGTNGAEYHFSHWIDQKGNIVRDYNISIESDETLTAYFRKTEPLNVTYTPIVGAKIWGTTMDEPANVTFAYTDASGNTISDLQHVQPGTTVTITPTVTTKNSSGNDVTLGVNDYKFHWTGVDDLEDSRVLTLNMPEHEVNLKASLLYRIQPIVEGRNDSDASYTTNSNAGQVKVTGPGIDVSCSGSNIVWAEFGTDLTLTAIANSGYKFTEWKYQSSMGMQRALTVQTVGEPCARFEKSTITLQKDNSDGDAVTEVNLDYATNSYNIFFKSKSTASVSWSLEDGSNAVTAWTSGTDPTSGITYHFRLNYDVHKDTDTKIIFVQDEFTVEVPLKATSPWMEGYGYKVPYSRNRNNVSVPIGKIYDAAGIGNTVDKNVKVIIYAGDKCDWNNATIKGKDLSMPVLSNSNNTSNSRINSDWKDNEWLKARTMVIIISADDLKTHWQGDNYSWLSDFQIEWDTLNDGCVFGVNIQATNESPF